jgi:hypothetical protein
MQKVFHHVVLCLACAGLCAPVLGQTTNWVVYEGKSGAGQGKQVVFLSGDDEYRSEEGLPMLAKILAVRHGFRCTVLFAVNPANGSIDPASLTNIPGMAALDSADLCVMGLRFRELPDADMKHFVDYLNRGKPIVALRTSTHAFAYERNKLSPYARFDWRNKEWPGGFGQQVLGATWIAHHGKHGVESTRGVVEESARNNPILRGVSDVWVPTDVYEAGSLPADANVLMRGQVLAGMKPEDSPVAGPKNNPMIPIVWTRAYKGEQGGVSKILTTTMGSAVDLKNEGLRRLLVNGCYWATGLQDQIPAHANVEYVGPYEPTWFGFGTHKKNVKPVDLGIKL